MTIGHIVETITSKLGAVYGGFGDCTAFTNKGPQHEIYGKYLLDAGLEKYGQEFLYNGMTGEQLETEIYIGPTYYLRLKHMPKDKINYRARGPRDQLTRQTVAGRANDGGLRLGEMDRDCVVAHGLSHFVYETLMKRGDEYQVAICNQTGCIAAYNPRKNIFLSPFADGPIKFENTVGKSMNVININKFGRDFSIVKIPYAFKLLMQELQGMNIQMRIITEDNIDQLMSLGNGGVTEIRNLTHDKNANYNTIKRETISAQLRNNSEIDRKDFLKNSVVEEYVVPTIISSAQMNMIPGMGMGSFGMGFSNEGEWEEPSTMGDPGMMGQMTYPTFPTTSQTGWDNIPSVDEQIAQQKLQQIENFVAKPKKNDKVIFNGGEGHIFSVEWDDDPDKVMYAIRQSDGSEVWKYERELFEWDEDPNYEPNEDGESDSEDDFDEKPPLVIDKDDADIKKDITLLNVEEDTGAEESKSGGGGVKKSITIDKE